MRLTKNKVEKIILPILGESGLSLIDQLYGKENVSEFDLAKKTKEDIKLVRKMLYLLYNHNLVGFIRKKDKEKGWYIYYWTLLNENVRFMYFKHKKEQLKKMEHTLDKEQKELFFVCPKDCVRLNFDQAMDFEFRCPECGELITQDDNKKRVSELKKEIKVVTEEIKKSEQMIRRKKIKAKKKEVKKKVSSKRKVTGKKTKKKSTKKKPVKRKTTKKKIVKKSSTKKSKVQKKKPKKKITKKKVKRKKK